jgi:ABC-type branched-subunit amino acid transport system substrate-binding protein
MSRGVVRVLGVVLSLVLVAGACGGGDDDDGSSGGGSGTTAPVEKIDYASIGLWDDGPCDPAKPELKIGLMTVFESPVISLKDQADGLEAAAAGFNERGGANGSCIRVTTCDDGSQIEQAVECVRTIDEAGVVATVNDQGTAGQAEVSEAMAAAGIPRVASNVAQDDWGDQNAYPLTASGTGSILLMPQALIEQDVKKIGVIRIDLAAASALIGILEGVYEDQGATFPYDVGVPAGTTDYSQFILGAQNAGVGGVAIALGEQEAVQVVRAGQQVGTDLIIGSPLGTFSYKSVSDLDDFAQQMAFLSPIPPATSDLPVYDAMRGDMTASGTEALQTQNLKVSPMLSWIGLYALLKMIRDAGMTDFTREGITAMVDAAKDVPMLDIFGGENWTPDLDHPGVYKRAGINQWSTFSWDPKAKGLDGDGNFAHEADISFDEVLCGSPFGAPADTC